MAAEAGHNVAKCNLGNCYFNGYGVEQNYEKAIEWYTKAASKRNKHANTRLSRLK